MLRLVTTSGARVAEELGAQPSEVAASQELFQLAARLLRREARLRRRPVPWRQLADEPWLPELPEAA